MKTFPIDIKSIDVMTFYTHREFQTNFNPLKYTILQIALKISVRSKPVMLKLLRLREVLMTQVSSIKSQVQ